MQYGTDITGKKYWNCSWKNGQNLGISVYFCHTGKINIKLAITFLVFTLFKPFVWISMFSCVTHRPLLTCLSPCRVWLKFDNSNGNFIYWRCTHISAHTFKHNLLHIYCCKKYHNKIWRGKQNIHFTSITLFP